MIWMEQSELVLYEFVNADHLTIFFRKQPLTLTLARPMS
jgi:hypothetical protein